MTLVFTPGILQCPMCEVAFPEGQVSLEDFESHVLEHFSYEDSQSMETIRYAHYSFSN